MWYISVSLPTNTKTIIWDCGREGIWCHFAQQDGSDDIPSRNGKLLNILAQVFFWFAQNYSLWLYPKYFMSSENLTKYYLTISLKWKGWTFPGNLVQIFSAKNRSWCDVSNKTISYVICMYEKPALRWGSISSTLVESCLENIHLASHWLRIIFIQRLLLCECWH